MNIYPVDEQTISNVERGRTHEAVLPSTQEEPLLVGATILFAHSESRGGQRPAYIKGGDSVLVSLTDVSDIGQVDPETGQKLFRVGWKPLGQALASDAPKASAKRPASRGRA